MVAPQNPLRFGYAALGFLFLASAAVGVILPGWPVTINCILALWAFKRSSPRMEAWLLNHPVVGPTLRDWEANRSIKPRTKRVSIVTIWICMGASIAWFALRPAKPAWHIGDFSISREFAMISLLVLVGVWLTWYISSRKTATEPA